MRVQGRRTASLAPLGVVALAFAALSAPTALLAQSAPARAPQTQTQRGETSPQSPVDDFNRSVAEVKKHLESLSGRIEESSKTIETLSSTAAARAELDTLQGLVADALGMVSDNSAVATLGQKVIDFARAKQTQLEADGKFTKPERDYLLGEWRRIAAEAVAANDKLQDARAEFAALLKTVQTRSDYVEELQALNNADQMLKVIRQLAGDLRSASDALKVFVRTITPPQAGS
jgi:chromosome segregation ATPase